MRPVSNKATRDLFRVNNERQPTLTQENTAKSPFAPVINANTLKSPFSPVTNPAKPWKPAANVGYPISAPAVNARRPSPPLRANQPNTVTVANPGTATKQRPAPGKLIFFDWRKCNGNAACCKNSGPPQWGDHRVVNVNMMKGDINPRFAVSPRSEQDIASNEIMQRRSWKVGNTEKLIAKLSSFKDDNVVFISIGANFGWATMIAAYAGFRVIAFEPLQSNVNLLRHSLCLAPPAVRNRVQVMPYGLGNRESKCELWAQTRSNRRRDAVTVCRKGDKSPRVQRMRVENFQKVGAVYLKSLDALLKNGRFTIPKGAKVVMQINVDGFEPFAVIGAKNFIAKYKPAEPRVEREEEQAAAS